MLGDSFFKIAPRVQKPLCKPQALRTAHVLGRRTNKRPLCGHIWCISIFTHNCTELQNCNSTWIKLFHHLNKQINYSRRAFFLDYPKYSTPHYTNYSFQIRLLWCTKGLLLWIIHVCKQMIRLCCSKTHSLE